MPLYTPEPDICHELLGHAPMFADPDFADFSQEIGLASLGASDEVITKLASCYWYSVEFGLLKEDGMNKAYGAGLLSSFGELEYSCSPDRYVCVSVHLLYYHQFYSFLSITIHSLTHSFTHLLTHITHSLTHSFTPPTPPPLSSSPAGGTEDRPELRPWNPVEASMTEFPITTYQPTYFVAENLQDAKVKMRQYCENIKKPFHARYNPLTSTIWVDRAVKFSQDVPAASSGPY
jgi:phenylalanine-4-hydroxylase